MCTLRLNLTLNGCCMQMTWFFHPMLDASSSRTQTEMQLRFDDEKNHFLVYFFKASKWLMMFWWEFDAAMKGRKYITHACTRTHRQKQELRVKSESITNAINSHVDFSFYEFCCRFRWKVCVTTKVAPNDARSHTVISAVAFTFVSIMMHVSEDLEKICHKYSQRQPPKQPILNKT